MKKIKLFLLFITIPILAASQNKIHGELEYHYLLGLNESGDLYNINRQQSNMYGKSLRLSAFYSISHKIETGIGLGADRYENPGYNTFPLFGTFRYFPFSKKQFPYTYTSVGYSINSTISNPGLVWDLGVGYRKQIKKHFGIKVELGYNFKDIKGDLLMSDEKMGTVSQKRHSLSFGVGCIF